MNVLLRALSRFYLIGIGLWIVGFITIFGIICVFAAVGLAEAEKQSPHAFDHHNFINYNFFHNVLLSAPIFLVITVIVVVLLVALYPSTKSQGDKEE